MQTNEMQDKYHKYHLLGEKSADYPAWAITNYLERICVVYYKMLTVQRISGYISEGCSETQLLLAADSLDILPANESPYARHLEGKLYPIVSSTASTEFWDKLSRLKRPVVFLKENSTYSPIVDYQKDLFKFTSTFNSPLEASVSGVAGVLSGMFYSHKKDQREEQVQQLTLKEQRIRITQRSIQTVGDIAVTKDKIDRLDAASGYRNYLDTMLWQMAASLENDNKALGIIVTHVDENI